MGQGHVNQIFRLYAFSWNWFVKFSYWVVGSPNSVFRSINILTSFKNLMYWFFKKLNSPFTPCISLCLNWSLLIMTFLCYLCSLVGKSNFSTIIICLVILVISVLRDSSYTRKSLKLTKFEKKKIWTTADYQSVRALILRLSFNSYPLLCLSFKVCEFSS